MVPQKRLKHKSALFIFLKESNLKNNLELVPILHFTFDHRVNADNSFFGNFSMFNWGANQKSFRDFDAFIHLLIDNYFKKSSTILKMQK